MLTVPGCINLSQSGLIRSTRTAALEQAKTANPTKNEGDANLTKNEGDCRSASNNNNSHMFSSVMSRTNLRKVSALPFLIVLNGISPESTVLKAKINKVTQSGKFPGPFTLFVERFHQTSTLFEDTVNAMHDMAFASVKGTNETYNFK